MPRISKEELLSLRKKFGSDGPIARKFGITSQGVHYLRKVYGIPSSTAGISERNKKIVAHYNRGTSVTVLANNYGLSGAWILRIIRREIAAKKMTAEPRTIRNSSW